ncbi:MAG TPA: DUF4394 domain-containing protein [Solirubrobacterales bacterium]|jgi:hypothetical protein|nr:DUF4394 domain-containing protein [Solirubrobacterales bacterium]
MKQRRTTRTALIVLALSLALPVLLPAAGQATKSTSPSKKLQVKVKVPKASGRVLYGTDNQGDLVTFRERGSQRLQSKRRIVGLPGGVRLVGIDFRPKTGELFGVGTDSVTYRIVLADTNARALPVASFAGPGTTLAGAVFGVDFNPVPDRIRVVSDADQNLRLDPSGVVAPAADMALNPGNPTVVGAAYTNSSFSFTQPAATTLYVIDAATDTLNVQSPPNNGTLTMPLPLGIDVGNEVGFDIVGANTAYLTNAGSRGTTLYRVNLTTGQATKLGDVGIVGKLNRKGVFKKAKTTITGLAAVQD